MTTLAHKLGLRDGLTCGVVPNEEVKDFPDVEQELAITPQAANWSDADIILLPVASEPDFQRAFEQHGDVLAKAHIVWVTYKKNKAAPVKRETIWNVASDHGWKAVAQVSVNDTWSAVRIRPLTDAEKL